MSFDITRRLNEEMGISLSRINATIRLLEEGATIPFVARYRREATGNLNESRIRRIADRYRYYRTLEDRRQVVLSTMEERGGLTEDLRNKILNCIGKNELEDLFLSHRPKRKSKASIARQRGLEPLAEQIFEQDEATSPEESAFDFLSVERRIPSVAEALAGALHIVADRVSEGSEYRTWLRELMYKEGRVRTRVTKSKKGAKTKYSMYHAYEESVARIPSHRMLAIRRAAREKVLTFSIQIDHDKALSELRSRFNIKSGSPWGAMLDRAIEDGYRRLLEPSIQNEVREDLRHQAEAEAIQVFEENLRSLLLAPPAGKVGIASIEPGLQSGSKMVVVDPSGKYLEDQTIFVVEPKQNLDAAEKVLLGAISKHSIRGVVIGNGTGSAETETFVRSLKEKHSLDVFVVVANESVASAYAASRQARREFPNLDSGIRGAISLARRLQDPLSELVKIDPRSISVGQYQHEVDQKELKVRLCQTVESAVSHVGVDLNTATSDLLKYTSGVSSQLADAIVRYRNEHGPFTNREQLRQIQDFGDQTFEQAAGFLRISDGSNPLDRTAIHPESYALVGRMAESVGLTVTDILADSAKVKAVEFSNFEKEAGRFTLNDIREELLRPGRDPRKQFVAPQYRSDVHKLADLKEGMDLEGTVTNVTNFGAFVDIGVHQDGLVHISELSHHYVSDARERVHAGEVLKVKVIGIDPALKRISLSVKAISPKPKPRPRPRPKAKPKPAAKLKLPAGKGKIREAAIEKKRIKAPRPEPELSMEEKIRQLQEKFRGPSRQHS